MFGNYRDLPYIDEHSVVVRASREEVWERVVSRAPSTGFQVTESVVPEKHVLQGRHPFSRYALVFLLDTVEPGGVPGGATHVRAESWAAFPGVHGRIYRALVIGSGIHVVMVRRLLRGLK